MMELSPYLALVLAGFLPNEVWRVLGLAIGRKLDENSQWVLWARAVATAIVAAVVAKLLLFAGGALEGVPLVVRIGAAAGGFIAYLLIRRSVFAGVIVGEIILIAGAAVSL